MHLLWINEHASFVGGCEHYIAQTTTLLKERGFRSTLLYDPTKYVDLTFLESFDQAFPLIDLKHQLDEINPDLIYLHQYWDTEKYNFLKSHSAPVIRFFHDYKLFCLRESKITTIGKHPCKIKAGLSCYPCLGFIRRADTATGFQLKTLGSLQKQQQSEHGFDAYFTASKYMRDHAITHGFPPELVHTLPLYAAKPTFVNPREKEPHLLLFAAQLIWGKGLDIALHALSKLPQRTRLVVAGKGRHEQTYRKLARNLNLRERVSFVGQRSGRALEELFAMASCVVHPTRYPEPFGLIGPEAMRFGTPVVASDLAGIPEWLEHEVTGLLTPPEDVKELANNLNRVLSDTQFASKLGEESKKQYLEKFTPERHLEALLALFDAINTAQKNLPWKQCTLDGSLNVEEKIRQITHHVKEIVMQELSPAEYKTLLLIGGYGKGEGGVVELDGKTAPHNNLDFLLVTNSLSINKSQSIQKQVLTLSQKEKIGIDFSTVDAKKLKKSRPLVIWHDLIFGHQTLLGDPYFIPNLPFGENHKIDPWDMTQLLINRGTLLIINRWLLDEKKNSEMFHKIMTKHIMKTIIGYGDALLFQEGKYNWSYAEKRKRMEQTKEIPEPFKKIYEEAYQFRLSPHYTPYLNREVLSWQNNLEEVLKPLFFACESKRLHQSKMNVGKWWKKTLLTHLKSAIVSPKILTKRILTLLSPSKSIIGANSLEKTLFRMCSPQEKLSLCYPVVAFDIGTPKQKKQVAHFLETADDSLPSLRKAYLKKWSTCGDINFKNSVKQWGLSL